MDPSKIDPIYLTEEQVSRMIDQAERENMSNTIKAADQLNIFVFLGMLAFLVIGVILVQFGDQLLPSIFRLPKAEYEEDKENPT